MSIELPVIEGGTEIGKINIATGEVTVTQAYLVEWSCCMNGACCTRLNIPVTDFDIERIENHGYELDQIISEQSPFIRMPKNVFGSVEKNYPIKRKPYDNTCTFLKNDGLCGIHEFRPFACRIFPFQYRFEDNDIVRVTIHESNYCHQVKPGSMGKNQNEEFLIYLRDELLLELERRKQYFAKYGDKI